MFQYMIVDWVRISKGGPFRTMRGCLYMSDFLGQLFIVETDRCLRANRLHEEK